MQSEAPSRHEREAALATRLADTADTMALRRFRSSDLRIEQKPDLSPVTDADTAIEAMIRDVLREERPGDAVVGEEGGESGEADAEWRWVIDPIDGTKSFARGNENWATLIALQRGGETVVAVASMPALGHRYQAVRGGGATLNGTPLHVSGVTEFASATLAHTSIGGFTWTGHDEALLELAHACWDARGFGNALSHLAVARGSAEIGWTSRAYEWDYAALALIVEEAGGRFTDLAGEPARGGSGFSTNGALHEAALRIVNEALRAH